VVSGRLEVSREDPRVAAEFGPGSVVGGALCLGQTGASWSARALEASRLVSFSIEEWFNQMEEHPEMARSAMAALSLERERLLETLASRIGELVLD
jgi:CRP-like cAMP-binding protein